MIFDKTFSTIRCDDIKLYTIIDNIYALKMVC